jgi:hypothetical protein
MSKTLALVTATAAVAAVMSAPASAETPSGATFSGRCVGSGLVRTGVPLKVTPAVTSIEFVSTGTCTGTLNGQPVENAPYSGRSASPAALLSCAGGQASGDTSLSIQATDGSWTTLHLRFDDLNVLGTSLFTLRGTIGGQGWGQHQFTPDLTLASACLGAGAQGIGNTVSLATLTPFQG